MVHKDIRQCETLKRESEGQQDVSGVSSKVLQCAEVRTREGNSEAERAGVATEEEMWCHKTT